MSILQKEILGHKGSDSFIPVAHIRRWFAESMSVMYKGEVPSYQKLVDIVEEINRDLLDKSGHESSVIGRDYAAELIKVSEERHGAIRLGLPSELAVMRRLFAVMGMFPVGYYDLSVAGLPVHSTAFRPISEPELQQAPFRMFVSLLRLELIEDPALREQAESILARREIFSNNLMTGLALFERQGGLTEIQAKDFVIAAIEVFRWRQQAAVDKQTYDEMKKVHPLIADIVCFKGCHINHLTPRTLDIDACQQAMKQEGMTMKAIIEGPPKRSCPILLRQTAFTALTEPFQFTAVNEVDDTLSMGQHTARFGEIEQRGIALTPKGRELYDSLLDAVDSKLGAQEVGESAEALDYMTILDDTFSAFPDDYHHIRIMELAYFRYVLKDPTKPVRDIRQGIEAGDVDAVPMTYEDFLPVSAAGIFKANLNDSNSAANSAAGNASNQLDFESALGRSVIDPFHWYERQQQASIALCLQHD